MTIPAAPLDPNRVRVAFESPPAMPSIAASALLETRLLITLARNTVATLFRG